MTAIIWPVFSAEELLIAGKTVFGEARGLDHDGRKAVAHVIINRWRMRKPHFGLGLAAVCTKAYQFSCWLESDPNLKELERASMHTSSHLRGCVAAVLDAMNEEDFTLGSTHYHTDAIAPKWAGGHVVVGKWGPHLFYNTVK